MESLPDEVIVRARSCGDDRVPLLEFLVTLQPSGQLALPLERSLLASRTHARFQLCGACTLRVLLWTEDGGDDAVSVDGVRAGGAWILPADAVPAGGVEPEGVAASAAYFGIPLAGALQAQLRRLLQALIALPTAPPYLVAAARLSSAARVFYHGTTRAAAAQIRAEGLRPSFGMMGTAVYGAAFPAAALYAAFDHAGRYARRPDGGAVLRVIALPYEGELVVKEVRDGVPPEAPHCVCVERCAARVAACRARDGYDREETQVADHLGLWQGEFDGVHVGTVRRHSRVPPTRAARGTQATTRDSNAQGGDGGAKLLLPYVKKNEEYAWSPRVSLAVTGVAALREDGMPAAYDPLCRTLAIV